MAVGFREDFSYLNTGLGEDPFKDLFPKEPFEYTQFNIPKEEAPPIIIPDTSGGEDRDTRTYYNTPTGRVYSNGEGTYTYNNKQAFAPGGIQSELAWGLSNYGKPVDENNVPIPEEDLAWYEKLGYNLMPGKAAANFIGDQMLSNQIDAIDTQFDRLTAPDLQPNNYNFNKGNQPQSIPASNLTVVTDMNGNVYYTEKGSKKEQELEEKAVKNSLIENLKELGINVKDLKDLSLTELQNQVKNIPDIPSFNISGQPIDAWIPDSNTPVTQVTNQYTTDDDFNQGGKEEGYGGEISQSQIDSYADQGFDTWGMASGGYVGPLGNRR